MHDPRPLTWGVLGTGTVARLAMIPALARLADTRADMRLLAVASQDQARAQALAAAHNIPRAYGSYSALFDDPEISCIYLALPNHQHGEWTKRAAAAGKHVLCEKPLARNVAELDAMAAACQMAGVRLMEALMYRFHPRMERVRALLAAGAIGPVRSVEAAFCFTLTDEANYRWQPEQGGGALLDVGSYCVDAARELMGAEPDAVSAQASYAPGGVDEEVTGQLLFAGGRIARITGSFRAGERQSIVIQGEDGALEVPHPAFTAWHADLAPILIRWGASKEIETLPPADPYYLMAGRFTDAIIQGAPLPYSLGASRATARVVAALARAGHSGRREEIDE